MPTWTVEVCDRFGGNVSPLDNAGDTLAIHERLVPPSSASCVLGVMDPQALAVKVLERDLRIRRNGQVFFWGPITSVQAGRATMRVEAHDPFWHLLDQYFGPIQHNYLTNPNGEQGTTHWAAVGTPLTVDAADFVRPNAGSQSGQSFLMTGSGVDADAYMRQVITVTSNVDQPVVFTLKGHAKVETWNGAAFEERGLWVARSGDPANPVWDPLTADATVGKWEPYEVETTIPAGSTETLDVRAYRPNGRIRWGALSVTVYESTGTPTYPEDAIHPINRVIDYAQSTTAGPSHGPLNISRAGGLTGVNLEIHYQFADHGNIGEALLDNTRKGICDLGITYGAGRTLEVFSPRRGTFRPDVLLDIDPAGSLADFEYAVDAEQTYSAVRFLGTGDGPDREIGYAVDTSQTGGIVRERVETAPQEATIADLDRLAREELLRAKAPVRVPTFTTHEQSGELIPKLLLGDSARCRIAHGWVQEDAVRRVVGRVIDCRTDTMRLEVNA